MWHIRWKVSYFDSQISYWTHISRSISSFLSLFHYFLFFQYYKTVLKDSVEDALRCHLLNKFKFLKDWETNLNNLLFLSYFLLFYYIFEIKIYAKNLTYKCLKTSPIRVFTQNLSQIKRQIYIIILCGYLK